MRYTRCLIAVAALCTLLMPTGAARADDPPSWAVGRFQGRSRKYNLEVELRISPRGRAERYVWSKDNKNPDSLQGTWRDGKVTFGGDTYYIHRRGDGLRMVKESDENDITEFRRSRDREPDHDSASGERPPSWAVGRFKGRSRKYRLEVELKISPRGQAERFVWSRNNRNPDSLQGTWRDGKVTFGGDTYYITRRGEGLRMVKERDESDITEFRRVD